MTCFIDVIRPSQKSYALAFDVGSVLFGSLFIALLSQVAILLPFSPIPLTLSTLSILLVGGLLGSKKGALAVLAYIAEGCLGLPFFACAKSGFAVLIGPTGGYLLGFVIAAFLVGFLLEKGWKEYFSKTLFAMLIATLIIWVPGTLWLAGFTGSIEKALFLGVYPFIIGDVIKVVLAALLIPSGWKLLNFIQKSE